MKTETELNEQVTKVFNTKNPYRDFEVELESTKNGQNYTVTLSQMYEYVDVTFEQLEQLSKVFETKNINIGEDRESYGGCESCDYGSKYTLRIYVKDVGSAQYTPEQLLQ